MIDLTEIRRIIDVEYHDILAAPGTDICHDKIRVYVVDGSIVDVWFSKKMPGLFSYHWERRNVDGKLYRHDNFPDPRWRNISTFPRHFHNGSQSQVEESSIEEIQNKSLSGFYTSLKDQPRNFGRRFTSPVKLAS